MIGFVNESAIEDVLVGLTNKRIHAMRNKKLDYLGRKE